MPKIESQPFYNVMPEAIGQGIPLRKVQAQKADAVFNTGANAIGATTGPAANITLIRPGGRIKGFFMRKAILIPLGVIILALAGVGTWLLTSSQNKEKPAAVNNTQVEDTTDPDVTTPGEWLNRFFGSDTCIAKTTCGDVADPDRDGLSNKEEFDKGADPNNPDSDRDGIADGDEFHIFGSDPLVARTYREGQFNDADFVKGGFDINTNSKYTPEQLASIKSKIKDKGLHQPTLTTISTVALSLYDFQDPSAPTLDPSIDQSPQAKLDRDTNRQSTVKKIGSMLLKYRTEKKSFPATNDFVQMTEAVKSYNTVATNFEDPINKDKYVYGYTSGTQNLDFTLTYYSETQNQLIKYTTKDAEATELKENAAKNNEQRINDLENIKSALMVYSSMQTSSSSEKLNVFPTKQQYPSVLIENHLITTVPKDPNGPSYDYQVNEALDSFTLKATFQNPPKGVTGYICNELECKNY
jgi:hypothetical protein